MEDYVIISYLEQLSNRLEKFKKVDNTTYNFRCPLCGDSKTNTNKKRGYIYKKENVWHYHCFNCGASMSFKNFLSTYDVGLYEKFIREGLKEKKTIQEEYVYETKDEDYNFRKDKKYLTLISDLPKDHKGRKYLEGRNVPEKSFCHVYWTDDFAGLVEEVFLKKYKDRKFPKEGIVFKLYGTLEENILKDYTVSGYQFRHIEDDVPKSNRFVTVMRDDLNRGVFGVQYVNPTKQVYVVEGPIDSLFIPNSIASINSSLWRLNLPEAIYINDCEPRNREVCKEIKKCIDMKLKTVMLPSDIYEGMDINDMVNAYGVNDKELVEIINNNVYTGLTASFMFTKWKKC